MKKKFSAYKFFPIFSIISIACGLICLTIDIFYPNVWLDRIGVISFTVFMLPFILLQFAMNAGIKVKHENIDIPFWGCIVLHLLVFPFAHLWTISCLGSLFDILFMHRDYGVIVGNYTHATQWAVLAASYFTVTLIGLAYRALKNKKAFII